MNRILRRISRRGGFALVVTLAALVFITVIVLAFFSRAQLNRQIAFSSTNMAKSDYLARTALDFITGELRQEIRDGSTNLNGGNASFPAVYQPLSNTNASPVKAGVNNPDANGSNSIVKVSASGQALRPLGTTAASSVSITDPSANGRFFSTNRWFGSGGPGFGSQAVPPTWFYFTRVNGVQNPAVAAAKNPRGPDYVIGRFACTVYDTSGMLDANVAGYPSVAATNAPSKSSVAYADLTLLDTGFTTNAVNTFVNWRNGATDTASATNYDKYLTKFAAPHGFLEVKEGQNAFLTRRDLLNAAANGLMTTNVTPYFSHFSRAVMAPIWGPTQDSPFMSNYFGGDGTTNFPYFTDANSTTSVNRFVPNVRHAAAATVTHYSDEGIPTTYAVQAGDPVVPGRFSLAKLAWIGWNGPNTSAFPNAPNLTKAIRDCFGLEWNSAKGKWSYQDSPSGTLGIKTLAQVADEHREPNFFEMLNAGILSGSLGQHPGEGPTAAELTGKWGLIPDERFKLATHFDRYSGSKARHLLQIGANVIDQYDSDSYPILIDAVPTGISGRTEIEEVEDTIAGVENLPYLQRIISLCFEDPLTSTPNDPSNQNLKAWFLAELWNPHQQRLADGSIVPTQTDQTPTRFRFRAYGQVKLSWTQDTGKVTPPFPVRVDYDSAPGSAHREIVFNDSDTGTEDSLFFNRPTLVRGSNVDKAVTDAKNFRPTGLGPEKFYQTYNPNAPYSDKPNDNYRNFDYAGVFAGEIAYSRDYNNDDWKYSTSGTANNGNIKKVTRHLDPDPQIGFVLECWDGFRWRPYSSIHRFISSFEGDVYTPTKDEYKEDSATKKPDLCDGSLCLNGDVYGNAPDPRTGRFSVGGRSLGNAIPWNPESTMLTGVKNNSGSPSINKVGSYNVQGSSKPSGGPTDGNYDFPHPKKTGFRYVDGPYPGCVDVEKNGFVLVDLLNNQRRTQRYAFPGIEDPMNTYYVDPDGVVRPADGDRFDRYGSGVDLSAITGDGNYLFHFNADNGQISQSRVRRRPIVLNRPFASVGELGYVFRDLPGRNLDLWSPFSPDSGLLDLFCVNQEDDVVASKISVSRASQPVLLSLLAGAGKASLPASSSAGSLPASSEVSTLQEAQSIASAVTNAMAQATNSFANNGDMTLRLAVPINNAISTNNNAFKKNKAWAEAPIRVLAQVNQNNTWNLLVDVVAQSGRITAGASSLGNFIVEGEKRYWLNLAIDRTSGEVIAQQLEPAQ